MNNTLNEYKEIIDNFKNVSIGVIGDFVADVYVFGKPHRLSREAPVIIVKYEGERMVPGSAGNTTNNLSKLGAKVYPVGIIGDDKVGNDMLQYFLKDGVDIKGLFICAGKSTVTKTRLLAGDTHTSKRQIVRLDKEPQQRMTRILEQKIIDYMDNVNSIVDAWVVSDYGYDVITPEILEKVRRYAEKKVVVVDSRYRLRDFVGVTIIAPNESEAASASGIKIKEEKDLVEVGKKLLNIMKTKAVLITCGNRGMVLFEGNRIEEIPICGPDEVTDVTGAGDTVVSMLAASLASNATFSQAARLSNYAAGIVVMKNGTATLTCAELMQIIEHDLSASSGLNNQTARYPWEVIRHEDTFYKEVIQ
ncbi:MAG TPA: bifunctional heptose 7-phosphate kinase/heptose 1-phosphate adenyltransferase [Candidatus Brocadiia bacterium]|nr:bifunctional hydroxymethylpyrimidine kinase/phosphomethylpyrimidine kinase [Planctomycetota bacterium]MBI4008275.1 bifunctional hydroxymethylpyrimidine kinase/phosphomethylpyrimidine kinase [Planctomycetota bacterium]